MIETKDVNFKVRGKDGLVQAIKIQKHKPSAPMCFIRTVTGHMLFCQEDHPVCIRLIDGQDTVVEAKDVVMFHDRIWVDNTEVKIPVCESLSKKHLNIDRYSYFEFLNILEKILKTSNNDLIVNNPNYFIGDNIYNFCLNLEYLNLYRIEYAELLSTLIVPYDTKEENSIHVHTFESFNLISQIKQIADYFNWGCVFDLTYEHNSPWYLRELKFNKETDKKKTYKEYVDVEQVISGIENYQGYVYDLKTESEEFMNNNVQTHNSFHCIKKEQLVGVIYNDEKICISFEKLWNLVQTEEILAVNDLGLNQYEKVVDNLLVLDKDNNTTKVNKLIRHKKQEDTKMVMVRNNNSDFIISQDNHPNMFALNYGGMCHKCIVPFTKTKKLGYWECPECKQRPHSVQHASDNDFNMVEPKQFKKSKYFSYNNFPIWNNHDLEFIPPIDPYLFGMFLAEGSYLYYYKGTHLAGFIITQNSGEIQDNIIKILTEHHNPIVNGKKAIIVYDAELANTMLSITSKYSWQKSMGSKFIHYSDETLSKILCGFIDGDGSFIQAKSKERCYVSLESTSLELIQQLHLILNKFNVNHKITVCTVKKLTKHQSYNIKIFPYDIHSDIFKYSLKVKHNDLPSESTKETYPTLVSYCKEILFDDDEYVYDFNTESGTLMTNGMLTHNTGGAVEFKKIDILKELGLNIDSNEETHLKRLFNQVENDLFCNNALTKIVINKSLFQDEYAIKKDGDVYKLPLGYFVLSTGELRIDATIEQPIELSIPTDYSETSSTIELIYGQGAKILHIKSFSIAPEKIAQHLDSLVGGKSPYTSPESLLRKFHNDLAGFNNYDMTHLEVIVASVLRNKLDPMIPARLKEPYNPETFSIKALPGVISWSLGMAYENISKALSTGLISDDTKNLSQIEKVLYGEPLSELSHELLAEKRKKR